MGLTAWIEVGHARADHGLRLRGAARDQPAARAPGPAGGHAVKARRGWPTLPRCGVRHRGAVGPGRSCAASPTRSERGTAMRPRLLLGVVLGLLTVAAGLLGPSGGHAGGHAPISPTSISPSRLH